MAEQDNGGAVGHTKTLRIELNEAEGYNTVLSPTDDWGGSYFTMIGSGKRQTDIASLIVRSVNSHDKLVEALEAVIAAMQAYLPPDGISAKECISRILSATDNPTITAILSDEKRK